MSIVFTPKIPYGFKEVVAKPPTLRVRDYNSWSTKELRQLLELRAIGTSYRECGKLLARGRDACAGVMRYTGYINLVKARHSVLSQGIMEGVE
jgi:hypothetical protein